MYQGEGIEWDSHGKKSDFKSITHKQYSDGACSNEKVSEEKKDGECFASPAAKTVPFWFRTVFVILAAVVSLH